MSRVPFGASKIWTVDTAIAEVAAYYAIAPNSLKSGTARGGGIMPAARDALAWALTKRRGLSSARAGQMLALDAKTVRNAAKRHAERMAAFNARFAPLGAV